MLDIILDCFIDTLKVIPFLFCAFLLIEFIENHLTKKNKSILTKTKKFGPLMGGVFGMIPQCGFSALATNLFSSRVITMGTLIAVYLSTSDEMLPILLSGGISILSSLKILFIKAIIGIIFGYLIDIIYRKQIINENREGVECFDTNCDCNDNIFLASIKHTLMISLYIFIASIITSLIVNTIGVSSIKSFISKAGILSYICCSIIGLIPNCSASVILTEVYISNIITLGQLFSGLLTGSGIGILILFRVNKSFKKNLLIVSYIYTIGIIMGFIIDLLGITL